MEIINLYYILLGIKKKIIFLYNMYKFNHKTMINEIHF